MKTYTCAICGETVTRPKSVGTKDKKRICRFHPEGAQRLEEIRFEEGLKTTVSCMQIRDRRLGGVSERTLSAAVMKQVMSELTPEEREALKDLTAIS